MEPGMIDSGVVFAYRYLTSKHPTKAVKCLMEIVEDVNIDYLKDSTADGMRVYTQELFAQGAIYSRSIPTTLLVQAFYNEHILSVVAALLSSTRDYIAYNGASSALPSHQGAVVAQIPLAQEDCGRTFGGMYESLLRRGSLCLALFRCCGQQTPPTPLLFSSSPPLLLFPLSPFHSLSTLNSPACTLSTQHSALNTQHPTLNTQHSTLKYHWVPPVPHARHNVTDRLDSPSLTHFHNAGR